MTPRPRHPIPPARWPDATEAAASRLFSPLVLASGLRLEARTWVPAMVPWRATEDGFVTPDVIGWYARLAEGRPAVLVVEATGIRDVPSGPLLRVGHDRFVPGLTELARGIRDASGGRTRALLQIIDFLAIRRRPDRGRFLARYLALTGALRVRLAVRRPELDVGNDHAVRSALAALPDVDLLELLDPREREALVRGARERITDISLPHVAALPRELPGLFSAAARRARRCGFDGVELHYAHAYTMASFLSRLNDRSDGYGGSPEARLRLPLEVLAAVRQETGAGFTVGVRLLGEEAIPGGSSLDESRLYAIGLARSGADVLSISRGGKFEDAAQPVVGQASYPYTGPSGEACMPSVFGEQPPFGRNLFLAAAIRRAVRDAGLVTPIVTSGGINDFDLAEGALARGDADLIGAARQSLADPDWWQKLRTGRGSEIQRCRYTNYCEALDQRHEPVTCQLWDRLQLDGPGVRADGRKRLFAPRGPWRARHPA